MKTCKRLGCGAVYDDDAANTESECIHHAGWPIFRDSVKTWTCCQKSSMDWDDFLKIPGCSKSYHSDKKIVRPPSNEGNTGSSSPPMREVFSRPEQVSRPEPAPEISQKPREQVAFRSNTGLLKCKHAGCMKEYNEDQNTDTSCEYHDGTAGFRDTKKFWTCCGASSYDWDEFMKIPKCKVGRHEPKLVDVMIKPGGISPNQFSSGSHIDSLWTSSVVLISRSQTPVNAVERECQTSWSPGMVLHILPGAIDESSLSLLSKRICIVSQRFGKARRISCGTPMNPQVVKDLYQSFHCVEFINEHGFGNVLEP